ncbi:MAG: uroporphyrinogen decarboxylase family protein [Acidobacteriaceae bacterium]|nr:uroporphyrinogen decarboxylase family protein [Acidobacteriaceae bacterium]
MNSRERFFALLERRPVDRVPFMPITMMFAADQIGAKYLAYATDHRVMVEAQIRTAERFGFDLVSGISDPAREAGDLGASIHFFEDQPPALVEDDSLLADKTKLARLKVPDPCSTKRMSDRINAVALFKERVGNELVVEGWIDGPCAVAANLRGINTLMLDFYDDPVFVNELMTFVTDLAIEFARAQCKAGADLIGVGDAAASLIGRSVFEEIVLPHHMRLVEALRGMGVKTRSHICGKTAKICEARVKPGYDIIDVDSPVSLELVRQKMGPDPIILGNIPTVEVMEKGTPVQVRAAAEECYRICAPNHIISAGCEVPRSTPIANMDALRDFAFSLAPASAAQK